MRDPTRELAHVADEARTCQRCPLWEHATATVFGEGPVPAEVMLIGEQPGDQEDRQGHPFVGPAGGVLDRCLEAAGTTRSEVYLTNAVKHFKWEPKGKRRIHKQPSRDEVAACSLWLDRELEAVQPRLVVLLGATAAQARLGASFRVSRSRGVPLDSDLADHVVATVHPSSVLRVPPEDRRDAQAAFTADLRAALALLAG